MLTMLAEVFLLQLAFLSGERALDEFFFYFLNMNPFSVLFFAGAKNSVPTRGDQGKNQNQTQWLHQVQREILRQNAGAGVLRILRAVLQVLRAVLEVLRAVLSFSR
jgi:hypothetical protein